MLPDEHRMRGEIRVSLDSAVYGESNVVQHLGHELQLALRCRMWKSYLSATRIEDS
jgi:hypothetical protein